MEESGRVINVRDESDESELLTDAAAGATTLELSGVEWIDESGGQVRLLDEDDVEEVASYGSKDDDEIDVIDETETLELSAPLANAFAAGTMVSAEPPRHDRYAWVRLDDDPEGEIIVALIPPEDEPFYETGPRVEGQGEAVIVRIDENGDWIVDRRVAEPTSFQVEYLSEPVGGGTDELPPATSPLPELAGRIRSIRFSITPIANADPVTYEFHLATTNVNPPDATTKVAEIMGTIAQPDSLADGTTLQSETDYYGACIAKDADGAAAASAWVGPVQLSLVNSPDLVANAVEAINLAAESVEARNMAAVHVLANDFWTALTGQRVGFTPEGFLAYGSEDAPGSPDLRTSIPVEGNVFFKAIVEALGLDLTGDATLRGAGNALLADAALQLKAGVTSPVANPTLQSVWDTKQLDPANPPPSGFRHGLFYDPAGHNPAGGTQPTMFYTEDREGGTVRECRWSDGTALAGRSYSAPGDETPIGVFRRGSYIYVMTYRPSPGHWQTRIKKLLQSDFSFQTATTVRAFGGVALQSYGMMLGTIGGTDYFLELRWLGGEWLVTAWSIAANGDPNTPSEQTWNLGATGSEPRDGIQRDGKWFISDQGGAATVWTIPATLGGSPVRSPDDDFRVANDRGLTYDDAVDEFLSMPADGINLRRHPNWTWAGSDPFFCRYTWRKDNAPTGRGAEDYETNPSPVSEFVHAKRAKLRITLPAFPATVTHAGIYVDQGATEPILDLQTDAPGIVTELTALSAGAAPPAANTFPATGTPAKVTGGAGEEMLNADRRVRVISAAGDPATPLGAGEVRHRSDIDRMRYYNGIVWKALADDARELGYAERTSNQTGFTSEADLTGVSVTVDVPANRKIRIIGQAQVNIRDTGTQTMGHIKEDGVTVGRWARGRANVTTDPMLETGVRRLTPSAGVHTYKLTLERSAGTGSADVLADVDNPAFILVEDIGPA